MRTILKYCLPKFKKIHYIYDYRHPKYIIRNMSADKCGVLVMHVVIDTMAQKAGNAQIIKFKRN